MLSLTLTESHKVIKALESNICPVIYVYERKTFTLNMKQQTKPFVYKLEAKI